MCSVYSPFSPRANVSIWILKGTPFSPPCFLGVNSVLMQCTCKQRYILLQKMIFAPDVEIQKYIYQSAHERKLCVSGREGECVRVTCTKTEVLLFMSHRNSAALSCEGCVFGSTMPTDMGISGGHTQK